MKESNSSIKNMVLLWGPVVLWMMVIFSVSGIPHLRTPFGIWDFIFRKLAHLTEYFVLSMLVCRAVSGTWNRMSSRWVIAMTCIIGVLYSVSDEFHQSFVPGRWGSVMDVLVDSCGIMIFVLIYLRLKKLKVEGSINHENLG